MWFPVIHLSYLMLPKQSIIQYVIYINFYINALTLKLGGETSSRSKCPAGAKGPEAKCPVGAKQPDLGANRRGETSRRGNGSGEKCPGIYRAYTNQGFKIFGEFWN